MTEDERDAIIDQLPKDMPVWTFEDELPHFQHANLRWWRDNLNHPASGPSHSCCKTCGCGGTCTLGAFEDALITTVVRELDRLGALRNPDDARTRQ